MKKYLMIGFAAIAFASCSNHDFETMTQEQIVKAEYDAKFVAHFGNPASNQDWGLSKFKTGTRAFTRASDYLKSKYTLPTFRGKSVITKPTMPTNYYTTQDEVKDNVTYCKDKDWNSWEESGAVVYVDAKNAFVNDKKDQTIYVVGDVVFDNPSGQTGIFYVVTKGSSLKIKGFGQYQGILLAEGASLDITEYNSWENGVTIDGGQVYMDESSTINATNLTFKNGAQVLVSDKATISANNLYLDGSQGSTGNVTLWNEGTLDINDILQGSNENTYIYNAVGKTIEAGSLDLINNGDLLVNDGTVTITNEISLHNSSAEIVNNADMECGSFSQAAGAKMFNVGNMSVTGLTYLDNSNSGWQNEGQWTCGSFEITGTDKGANNIFNNCHLTVNGEFYLNRGSFILDSNAGVECESFKIDDTSGFYLGNKSVLDISGTLTTEIVNPEYGFFAYGDEYAVVKANGIETTTNDPESINYYGNLLVAINPHISQYTAQSSVKFTKDGQNIATIPPSTCSPGYEGEDDYTPNYQGRVMAEDLTASVDVTGTKSDWDFNDVVFDWDIHDGNAYILLQAAGGTLPLRIGGYRSDTTSEPTGSIEIHSAAGLGAYMVNTGEKTVPAKAIVLYGDENLSYSSVDDIMLTVQKGGSWVEITADKGEPAAKFYCEKTTDWCDEYVDIKIAYPKFAEWVVTPSVKWEDQVEPKLVDLDLNNNAEVLAE